MCAAVGHFCNGSHKVFRFEAPMKFGVHVVCPQAQVNEAVVLVHYIVQHSVLLFGPVVQAGVLLTEAIAKAHCQFKLCFCQECACTIPQALELHNRLHACNHGCMDLPVSWKHLLHHCKESWGKVLALTSLGTQEGIVLVRLLFICEHAEPQVGQLCASTLLLVHFLHM